MATGGRYTDFYEIWSYDVGPILRPYLEGGHDWSMWAWLITTNPNRHTFSLLRFQCTSHYSEYHGSDIGLCLLPILVGSEVQLGGLVQTAA